MQTKVRLLVEGSADAAISEYVLRAAGLPTEEIEIHSCGGKSGVARELELLSQAGVLSAALIDADELSVPDSVVAAKLQLGVNAAHVFAAVPTIEAWLFADIETAKRNVRSVGALEILGRAPLPELIPYPKYLAHQVFKKGHAREVYRFMEGVDVVRGASRCPSLAAFLNGMAAIVDYPLQLSGLALQQSVSRDAIASVVRELPGGLNAWRTVDGRVITAGTLAVEITEGSELGKQYATELLRVARDILVRKARRE